MSALRKLIPMLDRVLIQKSEALATTKGGIVIPDNAKTKVLQGTVIAVGPGSKNKQGDHIPMNIKVGDQVLLPEYGGTKVELEDKKEYHLFKEADILAKIE